MFWTTFVFLVKITYMMSCLAFSQVCNTNGLCGRVLKVSHSGGGSFKKLEEFISVTTAESNFAQPIMIVLIQSWFRTHPGNIRGKQLINQTNFLKHVR